MINIIRSLFNINKKVYVVLNNKMANKGKLVRVCFTIGQKVPYMKFSPVIVVKADSNYDFFLEMYKNSETFSLIKGRNYKFIGEHIDAGKTQIKFGTSLAFGIVVKNKDKLDLKLY